MAELTDEQIAEEERFLKGLPRMNWGAFIMPAVWGPAHGFWIALLFIPLWMFLDSMVYEIYRDPQLWTILLTLFCMAVMFGITFFFSRVAQPFAAHRAANKDVSRAGYLKRERIWTVISIAIAIAGLAVLTYYNLVVRPTIG